MARNEEKQQGRLNRIWLQKEREEGRLKDVHERRPKLATLNSASSVKKWMPSIKNEIEYYLQQSQLSHYPERKIAEFQLHIEALEKEYKRFVTKLRCLDPTCKHNPWTPRAYRKRTAHTQDPQSVVKKTPLCDSHEGSSYGRLESDCTRTGCHKTSDPESHVILSQSKTTLRTPVTDKKISESSEAVSADQDQPLSFDHTRLAVATAAFRGPSVQRGSSQTHSLAKVLQAGLPNLVNTSLNQTFSIQSRDATNDDGTAVGSLVGQKSAIQENKSDCEAAERTTEKQTGHILGLDCYSSSDEECDT